jgi:hypothetical protein
LALVLCGKQSVALLERDQANSGEFLDIDRTDGLNRKCEIFSGVVSKPGVYTAHHDLHRVRIARKMLFPLLTLVRFHKRKPNVVGEFVSEQISQTSSRVLIVKVAVDKLRVFTVGAEMVLDFCTSSNEVPVPRRVCRSGSKRSYSIAKSISERDSF